MLNGGYLHGVVDENGLITGQDIAFIYPDGETSFKGHFENKLMKKAFNVDVLEYGCDENSGLFKVKKFSQPISDQEFFYEPCTNIRYYRFRFTNCFLLAKKGTLLSGNKI